MNSRRVFLISLLSGAAAFPVLKEAWAVSLFGGKKSDKKEFPVSFSEEEWKARLTEEQFYVLRKDGTERPLSSALNNEKRKGVFVCAGCDHPLYSSAHKYESGTGWPSFYQPINKAAVGISKDYKLVLPRTEVHCANCGGHLGHVFEDGPEPTGLRYCMNGVAMKFIADDTGKVSD